MGRKRRYGNKNAYQDAIDRIIYEKSKDKEDEKA